MAKLDDEGRALLDRVDEFLSNPEIYVEHKRALWDVLTALRGCDFEEEIADSTKLITTVPVRRAAFPLTARLWDDYRTVDFGPIFGRSGYGEVAVPPTVPEQYNRPWLLPLELHHFGQHIQLAALALGILTPEDSRNKYDAPSTQR